MSLTDSARKIKFKEKHQKEFEMAKKLLLSILAVLLAFTSLSAEGVREIGENESIVKVISINNYPNGYDDLVVQKEDGSVAVYHVTDDTVFEDISFSQIAKDSVLVIKDSGIATMSIPPQLSAVSVRDITLASTLGFYDVSFAEPADLAVIPESATASLPFDMDELVPRFSYAYGYLSMDNLMTQNLVVRGNYFARGILDAIDLREDMLLSFDDMLLVTEEYFANVYQAGIVGEPGEMVTTVEEVESLGIPDNLDDEFSYAYGYILAFQIMSQGIELDRIAFPYGMLTRLYNTPALLTTEEMNKAVDDYIAYLNQVIADWINQMATENLSEAEAFLEENAAREEVESISDFLQLEFTARNAEESAMPVAEDTVTVNYTLRDKDGNVIEKNENVSFNLAGVIEGFRTAITNMHVGDSVTAYIHPSIGYGENGAGTIEPNQLLIFDIDLISIDNAEAEA